MQPTEINILVVDDDLVMLRLIRAWLERAGYSTRTVTGGEEALHAIKEACPDILVTDWDMPGMDGLELCRRTRQLDLPHYVYTIFVTGKSTPQELIEGLEAGADEFLTKPVFQGELLARLKAGLRVIELERQLNQLARTDALTGLMNRRTFLDTIERAWSRHGESGSPLSCVILDLDYFKRINDIHGHRAGDSILQAVANLLMNVAPTEDCVCRYGGEEFCVLLPNMSEVAAAEWAESARCQLAKMEVPYDEESLRITGSFGVAQRREDTQTVADLLDQADQALLCAKKSGRNQVVRDKMLNMVHDAPLVACHEQENLFRGIVARDVIAPVMALLHEDDTVGKAAEFFLHSRVDSAHVIDSTGKLVGAVSEKDLMATLALRDWWQAPVKALTKPSVICYDEETPIQAIYEFLCRVSLHRVIIVKDGQPTGSVSTGTLLRWFGNLVMSKSPLGKDALGRHSNLEQPPRENRSMEQLMETTTELARQAKELQEYCSERAHVEDLGAGVVGGATRMQELVDNLLACSRHVGSLPHPVNTSMFLGGPVD